MSATTSPQGGERIGTVPLEAGHSNGRVITAWPLYSSSSFGSVESECFLRHRRHQQTTAPCSSPPSPPPTIRHQSTETKEVRRLGAPSLPHRGQLFGRLRVHAHVGSIQVSVAVSQSGVCLTLAKSNTESKGRRTDLQHLLHAARQGVTAH